MPADNEQHGLLRDTGQANGGAWHGRSSASAQQQQKPGGWQQWLQQLPPQLFPAAALALLVVGYLCYVGLDAAAERGRQPSRVWHVAGSGQRPGAAAGRAAAGAAAARGPAVPPDLNALQTLDELLEAHQWYQEAALAAANVSATGRGPPAIVARIGQGEGLGNRVPSAAAAFLIGLLTGRVVLFNSSSDLSFVMPLASEWAHHAHLYQNATTCAVDWKSLALNARLCGAAAEAPVTPMSPGSASNNTMAQPVGPERHPAQLLTMWTNDWELPFMQVNPRVAPLLAKFFPGEVFATLSKYLFQEPIAEAQRELAAISDLVQDCQVGIHVRRYKQIDYTHYPAPSLEAYASVARGLAQTRPGNIFIASDEASVPAGIKALLPERRVWWTNVSALSIGRASTRARNPGTELSAIVDMLVLSRCRELVVTGASSFGAVAAGLAGKLAVALVNGQPAKDPFLTPFFWRAMSSDPCAWKVANLQGLQTYVDKDRVEAFVKALRGLPLFYQWSQCHPF